jgi:hypothetical protein
VRVGDVVTYELRGLMFTHRVVRSQGGTVVCRGDNHLQNDPPVLLSNVLGRAVEVIGGGRLRSPAITTFVWTRRVVRSLALRTRHVREESRLLVYGIQSRIGEAGGLSVFGLPDGSEAPSATAIGDLSNGSVESVEIVPAGVFSRLPKERRLSLLRGMADRSVSICAFPRERQGRVERAFTGLRGLLRQSGLPGGDPGDNTIPAGLGLPPGYIHYFTLEEFSAELSTAFPTGQVVGVRLIRAAAGPLLLAEVSKGSVDIPR